MGSLPQNTEGSQNWLKLTGFVERLSLIIFVSRNFSFGRKIERQELKYRATLTKNFFPKNFLKFFILTIFWFYLAPSEILISYLDSPLKTASYRIFTREKLWFSMCPLSDHSWPLLYTSREKKWSHFGIPKLSGTYGSIERKTLYLVLYPVFTVFLFLVLKTGRK